MTLPVRARAPRFGSDVLRFGTAIVLALALNVVQVFIVPRRLSVEAVGGAGPGAAESECSRRLRTAHPLVFAGPSTTTV